MATNMLEDRDLFQQWMDNPLTVDFLSLLTQRRQWLMEAWAKGHPGADSPERQASAVILHQLADLSHDDVLDWLGIERTKDEQA